MSGKAENPFIASLAEHCRRNVPDEKILIAPTRRIGRQWLGRVVMGGSAVVNVRMETLSSLAMRLAAAELAADGKRLLPPTIGPLLVEMMLENDSSDWPASPGLPEALYKTLSDLRNAAVTADDLERAGFETSQRGERLVRMFKMYSETLNENGYFDSAELYLSAAAMVSRDGWRMDAQTVMCSAAEQAFWTATQWALWRAIPQEKRIVLESVVKLQPPENRLAEQNASLRQRFSEALEEKSDKMNFFRSLGQAAEVREIFRRCLMQKIPLDEVEILYTEKSTYLPLLCEECSAVFGGFDAATFIQGIPAMYSRPGRLVMEWCDWVASNFSQKNFSRIISDGLLVTKNPSGVLAEKLATLPVGFGRQRWIDVLTNAAELNPQDAVLEELCSIATLHAQLSAGLECKTLKPEIVLKIATELVSEHSRCANALDNLARQRLTAFLEEFADWYDTHPSTRETPLTAQLEWLKSAVCSMTVNALGPMSGRIHIGPLRNGGQTGRKNVFIVGMNEGFFPGRGRQDPLLMDSERQNIFEFTHKLLPLSWHSQHESTERLIGLLADIEGRVTLSYCCHEMIDDREMYPATILLMLAAILKNASSFSLEELDNLAGQPTAFLPEEKSFASSATRRVLADFGNDPLKMEFICRGTYANINDGFAAAAAWNDSTAFTEYDGSVKPWPQDKKPTFSPSRLETLAACPRKFMFTSKLKIERPEEISPEAETWLNAADFGTLLHDSFCEFYRLRVQRDDFNIAGETTRNELVKIIETNMEKFKLMIPVPGENALRTTRRQAFQAMDIFLQEEAIYLKEHSYRPLYMEAAIGLPPEQIGGTCGTKLDCGGPLEISTGDGSMFIRGRIDRIDADGKKYAIWDYKTGSAKKFRDGRFNQGRILQHYLYSLMAGRLLSDGEIESVGYYFTSYRGRGERITYAPADLQDEGREILANLRKLVATGAYPATTDANDCTYCDYKTICGDIKTLAGQTRQMLHDCGNTKLDAMRKLRGLEAGDE